METWYFAYGSNLWMDQMIERTGAIGHPEHAPRIACLANHRLIFQHFEDERTAFANVVCPGDGVFGMVYRCSTADLDRLDRHEDGYERQAITVTDSQGEVLTAVAYVVKTTQAARTGRPSAEYLERIVAGARQHGLPEPYIGAIVAIAAAEVLPGDRSPVLDP